jgi:hypothetical protein
VGIVVNFFAVLVTGEYPEWICDFLVSAYRYALRVEAHEQRLSPSASDQLGLQNSMHRASHSISAAVMAQIKASRGT